MLLTLKNIGMIKNASIVIKGITVIAGVNNTGKYYISELNDELAVIYDVTEDIDVIYREFARPFQELENERYENH